ncbi:MAG: hypothetical protein INQ03_14920 [Candidatus Heimdallarchaeota archaeon]|nr:hypothetical protein [Candidatus Heimdallarchaeota archaeon]
MEDDDWLKGEDDWISEEKTRNLSIPGIALPGLRDLKIQFVALIEFDLFLGPVVYINELSRGSSYINKLRDHQTISEVYAGVARADVETTTTLEDLIAIFRFDQEGTADVTTVLLISCIPGADLDPVKELGSVALFRSKGDPDAIGQELSKYLREQLSKTKKFKAKDRDKIVILDENRLQKSLDYERIKGIAIIDYSSKLADFRNFPSWVSGVELIEMELVNFIDQMTASIAESKITSFIYKDNILLATKIEKSNLFIILLIEEEDILALRKTQSWIIPFAEELSIQWKLASSTEISLALQVLDAAIYRGTMINDVKKYVNMILRGAKLKPTLNPDMEVSIIQNTGIEEKIWNNMLSLDGSRNIIELSIQFDLELIDLLPALEWARLRDIVIYFEE